MNYRLPVALISAVAIGAVSATGVLLASGDPSPATKVAAVGASASSDAVPDEVIESAAEKLGVSADVLRAAIESASAQLELGRRDTMFETMVQGLIDSGRVTAEQGAALKEWYSSRPEALGKVAPFPAFPDPLLKLRVPGLFGLGVFESDELLAKVAETLGKSVDEVKSAFAAARAESVRAHLLDAAGEALGRLVEAGSLTQAEADELTAWLGNAPDSLSKLPGAGIFPGAGILPDREFLLPKLDLGPNGLLPGMEKWFELHGDGRRWEFEGGAPFMMPRGFEFSCTYSGPMNGDGLEQFFGFRGFGPGGQGPFGMMPEGRCDELDGGGDATPDPATPDAQPSAAGASFRIDW